MPLRFSYPAPEYYKYPLLIRYLLSSSSVLSADKKIHYRDRASFTYRDFMGRVGKLASLLRTMGVDHGTTVAVLDWDSHRYLEAYFAVPMMGAVLQTVNLRLTPAQIVYTLINASAEVLIVHRDFFPLVEAIRGSLPGIRKIVVILENAQAELPDWADGEYEALSDAADCAFPFEDFDENAVATLFYTSGTTGDPKAVCFTHRQLVLHVLAVAAAFGSGNNAPHFGRDDVYMPLTPMFHVHAWCVPYLATMLGIPQVYPGRYEPDLICRLRAKHGVTFSHCVPTVLQMVLKAAAQSGADLEGWKVIVGGSALTKALWREGQSCGMQINAGYGMSETGPAVAVSRPRSPDDTDDLLADALTHAGVPVPLVLVRVVDEAMNDLPHDGSSRGELIVRSPWLASSYVGDPVASEALWRGGWLHTQDVATIDSDGFVRIRDRLKDVIKSGGEWIDSVLLEEIVATAAGVSEAAVIGLPDPHWGERPFAAIVGTPGSTVSLDGLNTVVLAAIGRGEITRYARLEGFRLLDQLPKTSVGKIDKEALRRTFGATAQAEQR